MRYLTSVSFDLARVANISKRTAQIVMICSLMAVLQSCYTHYVAQVPIAPIEVRGVSPYAGAVWLDGDWVWRGGRHTWVGGRWDHARTGSAWHAGEWRQGARGNYYVRGRWR
jgi:hypothetical protein